MPVPLIAIAATFGIAWAIDRLLGPPSLGYWIYAVEPRNVEGFLTECPDALTLDATLTRMNENGYSDMCGDLIANAERLKKEHPDCMILVADFRPL